MPCWMRASEAILDTVLFFGKSLTELCDRMFLWLWVINSKESYLLKITEGNVVAYFVMTFMH
jgi:hypothetical protein